MRTHICTLLGGCGDSKQTPGPHCLASLASLALSHKVRGKQLRKTTHVALWPPRAHPCVRTHRRKQFAYAFKGGSGWTAGSTVPIALLLQGTRVQFSTLTEAHNPLETPDPRDPQTSTLMCRHRHRNMNKNNKEQKGSSPLTDSKS